jgi:uncharacterized membrane protein
MWRSREANIFYVVLVAVAAHIAVYAPQLPERVPSHFRADGTADSFSGAGAFLWLYAGTVLVLALTFVGCAFLMLKGPPRFFNLPRRDYWLAPVRARATREAMARSLLWFGAVTIAFIAMTMHLSMLAALDGTDQLGTAFWWLFGAFMLYSFVWAIRLIVRFSNVPKGE